MEHQHDYKVINEDASGRLEICLVCKKRLVTIKDRKTGRIDNKKYIKEHIRDTAQPNGRTGKIFAKYYGDGTISKFKR